ncbi:salicylate 1-monooxygenase [Crucibulum laeve]|uniref:Salicylate 1-monooxygenase n=1 Tax=Crucibulum laeve TaxID=68775 RepID=A0A5C3LHL0_9AGAR|nr:salicylate 1-monooxygenase [Crucibulum laeve]
MTAGKKLKVVVCGGGIGGLTFALALSKYPNVSVDIYEAASRFSPIGAGIGIWMRVWNILSRLGLDELADKTFPKPSNDPVHAFTFRKSDEPEGIEYYNLMTKGPFMTFLRYDFQKAMLEHLPRETKIHYSRRFTSYTRLPSGEVHVSFQDGLQVTCDLLVGADGIKSSVRRVFLEDLAQQAIHRGDVEEAEVLRNSYDPVWNGTEAYRGLVRVENVRSLIDEGSLKIPEFPTQYMGKNANMIIYPVANGTLVNIAAFRAQLHLANTKFEGPWVTPADPEELLSVFEKWEPHARNWLRCLERPTRWAVHTVKPLKSFVTQGVVLIGDAAHAMAPHQGSGAGQAMEDAYFLGTLLGHPLTTAKALPYILKIYDQFRRPFATDVARRSLLNGRFYTFNEDEFDYDSCYQAEKQARLKKKGEAISENWAWAWSTSIDDDMGKAMAMLKNHLSDSESSPILPANKQV